MYVSKKKTRTSLISVLDSSEFAGQPIIGEVQSLPFQVVYQDVEAPGLLAFCYMKMDGLPIEIASK